MSVVAKEKKNRIASKETILCIEVFAHPRFSRFFEIDRQISTLSDYSQKFVCFIPPYTPGVKIERVFERAFQATATSCPRPAP